MSRLPTELFEIVLHSVEDSEDLHTLAQTSRDLNFLAVEELCSRYGVQPWTTGSLVLDISTLPALSTLAISSRMIGRSLQFLSCDLTINIRPQERMMQQTASLANFLSLLASVDKASFYFISSGTKGWESAMAAVLDTLVKKSCTDLHIKTLARSESSTTQSSRLSSFFQRLSLSSGAHKKKGSKPIEPNYLESCYLQTLPTFLQPLLLRRFNTSSQLTTLTFRYVYNGREWEYFLTNLNLPNLATLTVSHCIIPDKGFPIFLQHHPMITSLDFHHNTYLFPNPPALAPHSLPGLVRLRTSSEYLVRYFPPLNHFSRLKTVILPAGDMTRYSARAVLALQAIVPCVNNITLCLEFTYVACLYDWLRDSLLRAQGDPVGETEPTRQLCCVETLNLDSRLIAYSSEGVVNLLVQWLGMFPALRRVFITRPCLPQNFSRQDFEEFARNIFGVSASMKTISVESDNLSVWTRNL